MRNSFIKGFLLEADNPEMKMRRGQIGLEAERFRKFFCGFLVAGLLREQSAQLVVQIGAIGFESKSALERAGSGVEVAAEAQRPAQRAMRFRVLRSQTDRLAGFAHGGLGVPLAREGV